MIYKVPADCCGEDIAQDTVLHPDIWKKFEEQDKRIEEIQKRIIALTEQLAIYIRVHENKTPPSATACDPAKAKVV